MSLFGPDDVIFIQVRFLFLPAPFFSVVPKHIKWFSLPSKSFSTFERAEKGVGRIPNRTDFSGKT